MANGASVLGGGEFKSYIDGMRRYHPDDIASLERAHGVLIGKGYAFLGWHGTKSERADKLINGTESPHISNPKESEPVWKGHYVATTLDMATGYCTDPKKTYLVLRVYVLKAAVENIFIENLDINHVLPKLDALTDDVIRNNIKSGKGKYLISGPDGTDPNAAEIVVSEELCSSLVWLPSSYFISVSKMSRVSFTTVKRSLEPDRKLRTDVLSVKGTLY